MATTQKTDRYQDLVEKITGTIVAALEEGVKGSWKAPWNPQAGTGNVLAPINATTGNYYSGGNVLALALSAMENGWADGRWATYKQWESVGAQVRKGERGSAIVKWIVPKAKDGEKGKDGEQAKSRMFPRVYVVFNRRQVEWDGDTDAAELNLTEQERIDAADQFLANVPADLTQVQGGTRAFYSLTADAVTIPTIDSYADRVDYYTTWGHELVHWTGHHSRLDRQTLGAPFGTETYAREELVAELGAAFLAARLGLSVEPREDHLLYLKSWLSQLREEPKLLWTSATQASKAVELLASFQPSAEDTDD